jgi:hypothetical protein
MINRVHDSLHLELEDQADVDKLRGSRSTDERMVMQYVKHIVKHFDR